MPMQTAAEIHKVKSLEQWQERALQVGARSEAFTELTDCSEIEVAACINAGRWLIVCGYCGNAPAAHPEWGYAICYSCGRMFKPTFPDPAEREVIELTLEQRPLNHRHWLPGETLEQLQAENEAAGLTVPYKPSAAATEEP